MTTHLRRRLPFNSLLLSATLALSLGAVWAQGTPSTDREHSARRFLLNLGDQQGRIWTAPFRMESWHSPAPYLLIAGTGIAFTLDDGPARRLREEPAFDGFNDLVDSRPVDWAIAGYPLAILAIGKVVDRPHVVEYGWKAGEALVDSFAVALVLKTALGRKRPHTQEVYGFWKGGNSFPSGHSAAVWALASVSVKHYSGKRWVPWVAYPLAGLVTLSRVSAGHHFFSDVAAGSMIGFCIGRYAVH